MFAIRYITEALESGLDRLGGILFVLMILSRIEDRRRRRRYRAVLDRIINTNNEHPSDQGRNPISRKLTSNIYLT